MELETFRERFPEFRTASDELVEIKLGEAARFVAPETFGDLTDDAVGYWAAHLLVSSPLGLSQRLEDDKKESTYKARYVALLRATAPRMLIT